MAETGHLQTGKSRRKFRNLFNRPSRASSSSTASQLYPPGLALQPSLGSSSPQLSKPPPPVLEASTPTVPDEQSAASLNLWEEVFRKVNDETQKWIRQHGLDPLAEARPEDQIKELVDLVEEKEKFFEEKDSPVKIKIGSQDILFRAYVADVIGFLTMAGDVAISFAPPQASAPWAAAKAVLKIPIQQVDQMAALAGTVQLFTRIVRRGQVYEVLYTNVTTTNEGAVSNLHDAHVDLYVAAIELLARSNVLFKSGVVKQTLNAILRPEQATGLISDLFQKEQNVSQEVQSCEALRNERAGKQTDEKIQNLLTKLDLMSLPLTRIDEGVARLLKNINEDQLEKLMDFISLEQFGKGHAAIKDARVENTGDWLIDHEGFQDWQAIASSSTLLFLKGTVGTGKTFLTSRVVDHVKKTLETSPHDEGFAFFYCSRSGPAMQDPLIILRSFVRQLSYRAYNYDYIQSNLIRRCEKAKKEGRNLNYLDCKELILESMNLYAKTTIILDALDESDIMSYNLAEILINMMDKATKPVKIFISSRPDREYLEAFEERSTITVNSSNQQGDIEIYLNEALYSTKFFKKRQEEIQELIKETFRSRNGGMFRWVYLQTRSLQRCVSTDAIRTWAKTIPRDLMAAYDQLWEDLKHKHNESDMALAKRAIQWVLCSFTPLKSKVLLEAIRYVCEEDAFIQKELQAEQEILLLCQDLLTIDTEKQVWTLPHASVAEYFQSRGMVLGECDLFASKVLLLFLMNPELRLPRNMYAYTIYETSRYARYEREELLAKSFEGYAVCTWFEHIQRYDKWLGSMRGAAPEEELASILKCFLGSPGDSSGYYRNWVDSLQDEWSKQRLKPINMALFIMCQYQFYYILRDWWEEDEIDQELALTQCEAKLGDLWLSPLDLAVESGCVPICRHLVSVTDVNDPRARGHSLATRIAIHEGNQNILTLLVEEARVDLNLAHEGSDKTCVQLIVLDKDDSDMLQWVIDQGWVDVNREGGERYGNALIAAAFFSSLQSVEVLLRAGADVNAAVECGHFGNALIAAASGGSLQSVEALLRSGAKVNASVNCGHFGSALIAAASDGGLQSVEILLRAGADVNASVEYGHFGSALIAACSFRNGHVKQIQTLLDSGADVNQVSKTGWYGNALESYVCKVSRTDREHGEPKFGEPNFREAMELLLKYGADPAMTFNIGEHGSALAAAAFHGLKGLVMMMVNVTEEGRVIECLRQNRYPEKKRLYGVFDIEKWEEAKTEVAAYLADKVGVDEGTLYNIGIQDITPEEDEWGYFIRYN